jgi:hypothetical protein
MCAGFEKEEASLQAEEAAFVQKDIVAYPIHPTTPIFPEIILSEQLFLHLR